MSTLNKLQIRICMARMNCVAAALAIYGIAPCQADSFSSSISAKPKDDAFYHQLLKLPESKGYQPTRTFTIVTDAEHGNRLVAEDDPNLRFNLLWMEQFRPGYQSKSGGSALGEVFRSYVKTAYKAYRSRNAQGSNMLPDENGSLRSKSSYSGEMDYNVKVSGDEIRLKAQYSF
ncbi:MAG: hypothetical protein JWM78_737 [Verrucomicrobiaceae bacterium]|nr:hypothetical protein [Verrucomicrobiaceae bacterium]